MNGVMNRKLLVLLGPVAGLVMFAGAGRDGLAADEPRVQGAVPGSVRDRRPDAARGRDWPPRRPPRRSRPRTKPYEEAEYRTFPVVGSRVAIWAVAQLHLLFAAFVLAVPIFAFIIEAIGYKTGDLRYDRLAHEFTKLLSVSFSLTATFGAFLTFMLIILYPKFTNYLMSVFSPTFLPYVLLFFAEAFFLYTYYYGWGKFHPLVHLGLGLGLNLVGTGIMLIANAWLTFMMSPNGVSSKGAVLSVWDAVYNYTWMPINVHRVHRERRLRRIGRRRLRGLQVPAGGDRRGARALRLDGIHRQLRRDQRLPPAPLRRLLAREGDLRLLADARAHDDGRGLLVALHHPGGPDREPLPRAPTTTSGSGMGRVEGVQPLQKFIKYLLIAIALCFMVWATPRSIIATVSEIRAMGGSAHPVLGFLGVMSAKNTAVNILILTTFMSFLLYRRTGKVATVAWAKTGHAAQLSIFAAAAIIVIFLGVYGYFVEATVRIGLSVPQVSSVLFAMVSITAIDVFLFRGARKTGEVRWGQDPGDLAVRADLHRGHLHLAHGAHGLRSLRAPPALACLRHHPGHTRPTRSRPRSASRRRSSR